MNLNWKHLTEILNEIEEQIGDKSISDWSGMVDYGNPQEITKKFLPEGIGLKLIMGEDELNKNSLHATGIRMVRNGSDSNVRIHGTMDASQDEIYEYLYHEKGWRTIIYIDLNVRHQALPNESAEDTPGFMIYLPAVLFSKRENAFELSQIEQILSAVYVTISCMLLRLGLTWYASRSQRLWASVPGAMMMVTPETIYEANRKGQMWFNMPNPRKEALPIRKYIPSEICSWIANVIGVSGEYSNKEGTRAFWIKINDGQTVRVEANLRPYRPWAKVGSHEKMSSGYKGIGIKQADAQLHLLLMRNVTPQWEAEKLQQEIDLARHMQQGLQPSKLPHSRIYDIAAMCRPASTIGGDLYDVVKTDHGRIAMIIGDATGHGVDSALLAALVSGAFRAVVNHDSEPESILRAIDRTLRTTSQHGFVTMIYMRFNEDGSGFKYGLAGHYPPIICRKNKEASYSYLPSSIPLGVALPPRYFISEETLEPGDVVAAFSDGLIESRNEKGEVFEDYLPKVMEENKHNNADNILAAILKEIRIFRDYKELDDDLTALIVKLKHQDQN